jgi:hypothetical protein
VRQPQSYPIGWTSPVYLYKETSFFEQGWEARFQEAHFFQGEGVPFTRSMGDGLFEIRAKGREGIGESIFLYGCWF